MLYSIEKCQNDVNHSVLGPSEHSSNATTLFFKFKNYTLVSANCDNREKQILIWIFSLSLYRWHLYNDMCI